MIRCPKKFTEHFIIHKILQFAVTVRMSEKHDNDALLAAFSATLRQHRTDAGLSQEELAHRAGKSIRYISLLESRRHQPSLATLKEICDGLGTSMTAFVQQIEDRLA